MAVPLQYYFIFAGMWRCGCCRDAHQPGTRRFGGQPQRQNLVLELKVAYEGENPEKKAGKAYRQMIDKHYAKPFPDAVCIAMVIDDTVRQITHVRG